MRSVRVYSEQGNVLPTVLFATALIAVFSAIGLRVIPFASAPVADLRIEPTVGTVSVGDTFTIDIIAESKIPVNAFAGKLQFDPHILSVDSINYNTSIADLWAKLPWYSNGDGTLNFAGGTTEPGGFTGHGTLLTVTFKTLQTGVGAVTFTEARILQHDGLGSDASLEAPIDALFTVEEMVLKDTIVATGGLSATYSIVEIPPSTDLNGDGKQTISDLSIFMSDLLGGNMRSDFNQDGKVSASDLSIILNAK